MPLISTQVDCVCLIEASFLLGFNLSIQLLILGIIYLHDLEQNLQKNWISNISNIAKGSVWNPKKCRKREKNNKKNDFCHVCFHHEK